MKIPSSFVLLLWVLLTACNPSGAQNKLGAKDFDARLKADKEIQLLDVRTPEEFSEGHLLQALNLNYYNDDFKEQANKLDKSKPVAVYCRSGARSSKAADILRASGFKIVYELNGGILEWEVRKFLVVK